MELTCNCDLRRFHGYGTTQNVNLYLKYCSPETIVHTQINLEIATVNSSFWQQLGPMGHVETYLGRLRAA